MPLVQRTLPRDAPHLAAALRRRNPLALHHSTTVDARLQGHLQLLARRAVAEQAEGTSVAIMVAEHQTGEVLAYVGSPAFSAENGALGFVDMTQALRSPGSTLKPLVYALAFDEGLVHLDTLINDAPVNFGGYAPQNFDGAYRGMLTVRDTLTLSLGGVGMSLQDLVQLYAGIAQGGQSVPLRVDQNAALAA